MMKRNILFLIILSLFTLSRTVVAEQIITLNNGWNLVSFYSDGLEDDTNPLVKDIAQEGIERIFAFINGGWQFYDMISDSGSLGEMSLSYLRNRGVWIKSNREGVNLTLIGEGYTLDGTTLQPGWNLVGLGPNVTDLASLTSYFSQYSQQPLRLFAFDNSSWQFRDMSTQSGSLTTFDSNNGLWIYMIQPLTIGTTDESEFDLGNGLAASLYSTGGVDESAPPREVTIALNDQEYRLSVAEASGYFVQIRDQQGTLYSQVNIDESNRFDLGQITLPHNDDSPPSSSPAKTLYVYGLPNDIGFPALIQGVELYQNSTLIGTITDATSGFVLTEEMLNQEGDFELRKQGYLPTQLTITENARLLYAVMQEEADEITPLNVDSVLEEDSLARPLHSSIATSVPNNGNHSYGAVLLHASGRTNPSRSIKIRISPYRSIDAVVDIDGLASSVESDFNSDHPNAQDSIEQWSWQVIAGSRLQVIDSSSEQVLQDEQLSASFLGSYATIDPYQSQLISGTMEEYLALLCDFGASVSNNLYITEIDIYARSTNGWQRISDGVRFINPALDNSYQPNPVPGENRSPIHNLEDGMFAFTPEERRAVAQQLPTDQLIMTSRHGAALMSQDSQEGGYMTMLSS